MISYLSTLITSSQRGRGNQENVVIKEMTAKNSLSGLVGSLHYPTRTIHHTSLGIHVTSLHLQTKLYTIQTHKEIEREREILYLLLFLLNTLLLLNTIDGMIYIDFGNTKTVTRRAVKASDKFYNMLVGSVFYLWLWCPHWPEDTFLLNRNTLTNTINYVANLIPIMKQAEDSHNSKLTLCPRSSYRHCKFHCICRYRPYIRIPCKYRPFFDKGLQKKHKELNGDNFR